MMMVWILWGPRSVFYLFFLCFCFSSAAESKSLCTPKANKYHLALVEILAKWASSQQQVQHVLSMSAVNTGRMWVCSASLKPFYFWFLSSFMLLTHTHNESPLKRLVFIVFWQNLPHARIKKKKKSYVTSNNCICTNTECFVQMCTDYDDDVLIHDTGVMCTKHTKHQRSHENKTNTQRSFHPTLL